MNDPHVELLIRLDEKLDGLKEDIIELKAFDKRINILERFTSYAKGAAALVVAGMGYLIKLIHI